MALAFLDGFDYSGLTGNAQMKWDQGGTYAQASGRWGDIGPNGFSPFESTGAIMTPPLTFNTGWINGLVKTLPDKTCYTVGAAIWMNDLSDCLYPFIRWANNLAPLVTVWVDPVTHHLQVRDSFGYGDTVNPPVILCNSTFVPPIGLWWFIEVKLDLSANFIEVRVQGQTLMTANGFSLSSTAATINQLQISPLGHLLSSPVRFDDLYVINSEGDVNNDFLGEVRVQTKFTDTPGFVQDWVPATGTDHMAMLDTVYGAPNAFYGPYFIPPTSYVESGRHNSGRYPGNQDSYNIKDFKITGHIFGVQTNLSIRKDDVGSQFVQPTLHTSITDPAGQNNWLGNSYALFGEYTYTSYLWENDPSTVQPWTLVHLNAAEFGVKIPPIKLTATDTVTGSVTESSVKV